MYVGILSFALSIKKKSFILICIFLLAIITDMYACMPCTHYQDPSKLNRYSVAIYLSRAWA